MNRGMYTATTSLLLNKKRMDTISNNLANTNTTGFKKDTVISEAFPEVLLSKINDGIEVDNIKPFEGIDIKEDSGVYELSTNTGYFRVKTPAGIGYSRELRFTVDDNGYLKTTYKGDLDKIKTDGENFVLGKEGPIKVENKNIDIDKGGNILYNGKIIDNIVSFAPLNVIGTTSAGIRLDKVITNFNQGNIVNTSNNFDFALKGRGFFKVHSDSGDMYTRDGSFSFNTKGELITKEGHLVLGEKGSIIVNDKDFTVNSNGEILINGEKKDKLNIVMLANPEQLRKCGDNLYKIAENIEPKEENFSGEVLQGALEGSNVNTIKEMVNMISVVRNYESNQKVITSLDELLGKAVNEIGRV